MEFLRVKFLVLPGHESGVSSILTARSFIVSFLRLLTAFSLKLILCTASTTVEAVLYRHLQAAK